MNGIVGYCFRQKKSMEKVLRVLYYIYFMGGKDSCDDVDSPRIELLA